MSTIREDFEAHWTSEHERTPLTWATLFESSLQHKGQMPKDLEGMYFSKDAQRAWLAYQAATERAAKAVEGVKPYAAITHVVEAETRRRCAAAIRAQTGGAA